MIAVYLPSLDAGGVQAVVTDLAGGLADRGRDVELVLGSTDGPFGDRIDDAVDVRCLDAADPPLVGALGAVPALYRYLRDREPDAVVSAMHHVNVAVLLAHRLSGSSAQVVVTEHYDPAWVASESRKGWLGYRLADRLYPDADEVVAVSRGVARSLCETTSLDGDEVDVIHNPVVDDRLVERSREAPDHPWFDGDDPVVLSVGRFVEEKNYSCLLRAFAALRAERSARLLLVGRGERESALRDLAADLGVEDDLSIVNWVDNPYAFMRSADVFVLPSLLEGLPTVLIEALACECPVVATDCPSGPAEILDDGRYGTLVEPGDPDALARAVGRTLDDPPAPAALRERADDFRTHRAVEAYDDLLRGG